MSKWAKKINKNIDKGTKSLHQATKQATEDLNITVDNATKNLDKAAGGGVPFTMRNDEKYNPVPQEIAANNQPAEQPAETVINNESQSAVNTDSVTNTEQTVSESKEFAQEESKQTTQAEKDKSTTLQAIAENLVEMGKLTKSQLAEAEKLTKNDLQILEQNIQKLLANLFIDEDIKEGITNYYKIACKVLGITYSAHLFENIAKMPLGGNAKETFENLTNTFTFNYLQEKNDIELAKKAQANYDRQPEIKLTGIELQKLIDKAIDAGNTKLAEDLCDIAVSGATNLEYDNL